MDSEAQIPVHALAWQLLYQLSPLPSPSVSFLYGKKAVASVSPLKHGVASQVSMETGQCLPRGKSAWRVAFRPALYR